MNITEYISELDKNTGDILQLLKECSEEQLEKKSDEEWSILEILEHILISDKMVYNLLISPSEKQGTASEVKGPKIKYYMVDRRDVKAIAPLNLVPTGEIKNNSQFIEQFLKVRAFLVDALENAKITIDNGITRHPVMGDLSKTDWLNFIVHHAERHVLQIKDRLAGL